jgi:hypothetical protein
MTLLSSLNMKQPLRWINLTSLNLKTSESKFLPVHLLQRRRNVADLESNKLLVKLRLLLYYLHL